MSNGTGPIGLDPREFRAELNRQCSLFLIPAAVMALFSWIPYIEADRNLYPQFPIFVILRGGISVMGGIAIILRFIPYFKKRSYPLVLALVAYAVLASAVIIAYTRANPIYMGGLSILFLLVPIMPLQRTHSLTLLALSLVVISGIGFVIPFSFQSWEQKYGLYNLLAAVGISVLAVLLLDNIRKRIFWRGQVIQQTNKELERTTKALSRTNKELRKANEIKSDLLGLAAHDLKNPLQAIIVHTEVLKMKLSHDDGSLVKLKRISRSSENMVNLINEILKTATIDNGKLQLNIVPVDLKELAERVAVFNRQMAERKEQEIHFYSSGKCVVQGDYRLLNEIMDNLVSNAVKYSPLDSSIKVWVEGVEGDENVVFFRVRDDGPGFTPGDMKKIFSRFQRLSARPTGGESSTGLGLSIVKDLVRLHGGEIHIENKPEKGCLITVELPVSGPPEG